MKNAMRSVLTNGVTVSTVAIARGVYETAVIVNGRVSDPVAVSKGLASASAAHDHVCDCAYGRVSGSVRADAVRSALADVRA